MLNLKGLATGIGSLPYKDIDEALDLIFTYCPQIPFWPQLPKRDFREGMIAQFAENLPGLKITSDGVYLETHDREAELEKFYGELIADNLDYFKISPDYAAGLYGFASRLLKTSLNNVAFIKGQITGPFTFSAGIKDSNGVALLHNPVFMQAAIKALAMKALWQVKFFAQFAKKMVIFLDEPYLGCFGSAYTPINREDVVKGLSEITSSIKAGGALTGVHCCGNTDWSIFMGIDSIDIINFDAFGFQEKFLLYADDLKRFIERGGIICWGIVPTQEPGSGETPQLLAKRIKSGIKSLAKKGLDEPILLDQLLLSPSCGLGTLHAAAAKEIFQLLSKTSLLFR